MRNERMARERFVIKVEEREDEAHRYCPFSDRFRDKAYIYAEKMFVIQISPAFYITISLAIVLEKAKVSVSHNAYVLFE